VPPASPAILACLDADLAAARLRLDDLQQEWGYATYGQWSRRPEDVDVEILQVQATIAELEERRAALLAKPANDVTPAPALADPQTPADTRGSAPEYVDTAEAARILGVSVKTLEALRARGKPPPYTRVGRRIRYRRSDLLPPR
jgi:hypothetical protein